MNRSSKAALLAAVACASMLTRGPDAGAAVDEMRAAPPTGTQTRFAAFQPSTYNADTRTVELVLGTGAAVDRRYFVEELEISTSAVDISRVARGLVPLLNAHNRWEINSVLGTLTSIRFEQIDGQMALVATAKFADTEAAREAEGMVSRGELRGVSIGYNPKRWEVVSIDPETEIRTWRATSWELLEASLVPVPADATAGVRSAASTPGAGATAATQEDEMRRSLMAGTAVSALAAMAPNTGTDGGAAAGDEAARAAGAAAATAPAPAPEVRAAPAALAAPAASAAAPAVTRFSALEAVDFQEQARAFGCETRARELIQQNEAGQVSVEAARSALLQAAAEQQRAQTSGIAAGAGGRTGPGEEETSRAAIVDALSSRILRTAPSDAARQYAGVRMLELARERAGLNPRERDPITILRAAHTSSDFPIILEAVANRVLLAGYGAAQPTYQAIARRRDLTDFKQTKLLRIGDFPTLQAYKEDGEIKAGTINEGKESVTLGSYGRILRISRQAIVNDDLGAFDEVFASIGRMISRFENTLFYAMKAQNSGGGPKLSDGKNLFHADHGNLAASGGAPDITTLGAGRAAMRKQKDLDGNNLNLSPTVLLVGPDTETVAQQLTAQIQPVVAGSVNPFAGKLQVVAEGNITGNAWELYADPNEAPVFHYGYLADAPGPRVITEEPFNVDGIAFRATMDFYAGGTDHRGAYRNPGA